MALLAAAAMAVFMAGCDQPGNPSPGDPPADSLDEQLVGKWGKDNKVYMVINADRSGWLDTEAQTGTWKTEETAYLVFTTAEGSGRVTYVIASQERLNLINPQGDLATSFEKVIAKTPFQKVTVTEEDGDEDSEEEDEDSEEEDEEDEPPPFDTPSITIKFFKNSSYEDSPVTFVTRYVGEGEAVDEPETEPVNDVDVLSDFVGWFTSKYGFTKYDFNTVLYGDLYPGRQLNLFARWDKPNTVTGSTHDVDDVFEGTGLITGGLQYDQNLARSYRRSDGSYLHLSVVFNDSEVESKTIGYHRSLSGTAVTINVNGDDETFYNKAKFTVDLLDPDDYEISGQDVMIIKSVKEGNFPKLNGTEFILSGSETAYKTLIEEEHLTDFIESVDDLGLRQIEILTYSPDVIRLDGFLEGTYYYTGNTLDEDSQF
jgi:hypothetical protein